MKILLSTIIAFSILLGIVFLCVGSLFIPPFLVIVLPICLYFLFYKLKINKIVKTVIILCFLLLSGFITLGILAYEILNVVDSTWRYKGIIKDYKNNIVFEHFPREIPANAENIKFSYFGGFLQGGGFLFLKVEVDKNNYEQTYDLFKQKELIDVDIPTDNLKGYPKYRYIDENINDYETVILYSKPYEISNWNHGKVSGIGFNDETHEIIYWADFW